MIVFVMKEEVIIQALRHLLKEENDMTEDVFYNAGITDAIKEVERQYLLES
jgi:hypothetical protein